MPGQRSQAADHQLNPNTGEDDPLAGSPGLEQKDIRGIGEKRGSEIDQQKAHLMDFTAIVFASEPVTEFVNGPQAEQEDPEDPEVVSAFTRKTIQGLRILLHARPIACEQINSHYEYEQREDDKAFGVHP